MRTLRFAATAFVSLIICSGAFAQEPTQPSAPVEAATEDTCAPPRAPDQLMLTMPKEPAMPACGTKNTCTKAVASQYNASILAFNKAMTRVNEASADYVDELNDYSRSANRYAQCEIDRLNALIAAN